MFDGVFSLFQLETALENGQSRNFRTHGRKQTEWFRMKKNSKKTITKVILTIKLFLKSLF